MATKAEAQQAILDRITKSARQDIDQPLTESVLGLSQAWVLLNGQPA